MTKRYFIRKRNDFPLNEATMNLMPRNDLRYVINVPTKHRGFFDGALDLKLSEKPYHNNPRSKKDVEDLLGSTSKEFGSNITFGEWIPKVFLKNKLQESVNWIRHAKIYITTNKSNNTWAIMFQWEKNGVKRRFYVCVLEYDFQKTLTKNLEDLITKTRNMLMTSLRSSEELDGFIKFYIGNEKYNGRTLGINGIIDDWKNHHRNNT